MAEKKLWKSTIIIWSDYDPKNHELADLAREAESGDAYCVSSEAIVVTDLEADPHFNDGVCGFFNLEDEEEDEKEVTNG